MPEDGFKPHTTNSRPVPRSVGAIVTLRNGEKAVVSPYPPGEKYRFSTVWFQLGQEDDDKGEDIVSYRLLSPSDADRLLWDVLKLFDAEDGKLSGEDLISKRMRAEMRQQTRSAIENYLSEWPTTPETKALRKLERWLDPDEDDQVCVLIGPHAAKSSSVTARSQPTATSSVARRSIRPVDTLHNLKTLSSPRA